MSGHKVEKGQEPRLLPVVITIGNFVNFNTFCNQHLGSEQRLISNRECLISRKYRDGILTLFNDG